MVDGAGSFENRGREGEFMSEDGDGTSMGEALESRSNPKKDTHYPPPTSPHITQDTTPFNLVIKTAPKIDSDAVTLLVILLALCWCFCVGLYNQQTINTRREKD